MRFGWMGMIAAALLAPGVAQAEDWVAISVAQDGSGVMLIDADAMSTSGTVRRARILGVARQDANGLAGALGEMMFDCSARTRRAVSIQGYDVDGTAMGSKESEANWSPVDAGTVYAHVLQVACGEKPVEGARFGAGVPIVAVREKLLSD